MSNEYKGYESNIHFIDLEEAQQIILKLILNDINVISVLFLCSYCLSITKRSTARRVFFRHCRKPFTPPSMDFALTDVKFPVEIFLRLPLYHNS